MVLNLPTPTCFVGTRDAAKSRAFYEGVLGLKVKEETPFALVYHAGSTTLRVQKAPPFTPHPFTALGWDVTDIEATVDALVARGVKVEVYGTFPQDARGIWSAPGGARIAWFKDPDGNTLSLAQLA